MKLFSSPITAQPPNSGRSIKWMKFTHDLSQGLMVTSQNLIIITKIEETISKFTDIIKTTMKKMQIQINTQKNYRTNYLKNFFKR